MLALHDRVGLILHWKCKARTCPKVAKWKVWRNGSIPLQLTARLHRAGRAGRRERQKEVTSLTSVFHKENDMQYQSTTACCWPKKGDLTNLLSTPAHFLLLLLRYLLSLAIPKGEIRLDPCDSSSVFLPEQWPEWVCRWYWVVLELPGSKWVTEVCSQKQAEGVVGILLSQSLTTRSSQVTSCNLKLFEATQASRIEE